MQSTCTACYWGNTTTTAGIGRSMDTSSPIHVDGTWNTAMEAMNNALSSAGYTGYQWKLNEGSDKEDVPLVLVRQ